MASKSRSSIRLAVRACIIRCSQSRAPLACLGDFIEELGGFGWDWESIQQVERGALNAFRDQKEQRQVEPSLSYLWC